MTTRLVAPLYQVIDANGNVGAGYKLYFYETGTTTLKDTYSDEALSVANSNPVVADSAGRFGEIFGGTKDAYKVILKDADDNTIETEDPIDSITYDINSFSPRPAQHWGTTTGTADAYLLKPDPSITEYTADIIFTMQTHLTNNASATLAIFEEGTTSTYLTALTLKKYTNAGAKVDLEANDLQASQTYLVRIDGTDAVVLNPGIVENLKANDITVNNFFNINPVAAETTIASGVATISKGWNFIDTESKAASDDLVTVAGTSKGDIVIIRAKDVARTIVVKHGSDIRLNGAKDFSMDNINKYLVLFNVDGTVHVELGRNGDEDFVDDESNEICKAWVEFNGGTAAITDSYNVSGVVRNSAGNYTVSFSSNMPDTNYTVLVSGSKASTVLVSLSYNTKAVGSVVILNELSTVFVPADIDLVSVAIFSTY